MKYSRAPGRWNLPQRCEYCGASDNRDAEHARGCPALAPVPLARRLAIALECEAEWDRKKRALMRARGAAA